MLARADMFLRHRDSSTFAPRASSPARSLRCVSPVHLCGRTAMFVRFNPRRRSRNSKIRATLAHPKRPDLKIFLFLVQQTLTAISDPLRARNFRNIRATLTKGRGTHRFGGPRVVNTKRMERTDGDEQETEDGGPRTEDRGQRAEGTWRRRGASHPCVPVLDR